MKNNTRESYTTCTIDFFVSKFNLKSEGEAICHTSHLPSFGILASPEWSALPWPLNLRSNSTAYYPLHIFSTFTALTTTYYEVSVFLEDTLYIYIRSDLFHPLRPRRGVLYVRRPRHDKGLKSVSGVFTTRSPAPVCIVRGTTTTK